MKRFSLYILSLCLLFACKSTDISTVDESTLKENQHIATVLHLAKKTSKGLDESSKDFYLRIKGINYFVKFEGGYVSKADLNKHLNKKVLVKAALKTGQWEMAKPVGIIGTKQPEKPRSGPYVVIEKIYKNKKKRDE